MGTRVIIGNLVDGRRLQSLNVISGSWSDDIDSAEQLDCTLNLNHVVNAHLDLPNTLTPGKTFLAFIDTGLDNTGAKVLAAGPIWEVEYSRATGEMKITAKGMRSLFDHRFILPPVAKTYDVTRWTIPDPSDSTKTIPNPALTTSYSGISLGTIVKRLIQQAMSWPGGSLPIVLPADEADANVDHQRNYLGADFKEVGEAIDDLAGVIGGPESNFAPRLTSDRLGVEWVLQTGTVADPLIHSNNVTRWHVTAAASPVSDLTVSIDATDMGSNSWAVGGRQDDTVLVSRAVDDSLINAGYPLMEVLDSSHTSVSVQSTLDGYASGNLAFAKAPTSLWSFKVRANPVDRSGVRAGPQVGEYDVGDFVQLVFGDYDPEIGQGDPFIRQAQAVPLRIVGLSGDIAGDYVTISTQKVV